MASIPITGGGSLDANSQVVLTAQIDYGISDPTTVVSDTIDITGTTPQKFPQDLTVAETAITVPTGAIGLLIQFDSANTQVVTVYNGTGASAGGIPLHPTATAFIPIDVSSLTDTNTIYLVATGSITVTLSWV